MKAVIEAIEYYLPEKQMTNDDIKHLHPEWPIDKISDKTGISIRRHSACDEFSVDMGICAAKKLFKSHRIDRAGIDFILFCSQTPKFIIPANSSFIHEALGLDSDVGAIDINQGCSGYVYSLLMTNSLISSGAAKRVLLITADTYTKVIDNADRCLLPIFGDGASATLVTASNTNHGIGSFEYGTSGSGAEKLISQNSGVKGLSSEQPYKPDLYMNGPAIFNFTIGTIPSLLDNLFRKESISLDDVDHFIFHQANAYMLEHLREKIGINKEKFIVDLEHTGNTVSSSIPIVLSNALKAGKIKRGNTVALVGFGVGLSWAACTYRV